jgi:threonine/homoserine/homoserine lactone efflux protein
MQEILLFLIQAVAISLSGVMMPGVVTAATLAAGMRSKHAGALVAVGHGIVELPLIVVIVAGVGAVFEMPGVQIGIGLAGGAFMILIGGMMAMGARRPTQVEAAAKAVRGPILTGVILSAGNPMFLLWWATVGLALATQAYGLGILAFVLFAAVHWLCDLIWLEALSQASFRGTRLLKGRAQQIVLAVCAAAMILLGGRFLYLAVSRWAYGA